MKGDKVIATSTHGNNVKSISLLLNIMVIMLDRFCFSNFFHTKNFQDILLAGFYGQEQMFCSIGVEPY